MRSSDSLKKPRRLKSSSSSSSKTRRKLIRSRGSSRKGRSSRTSRWLRRTRGSRKRTSDRASQMKRRSNCCCRRKTATGWSLTRIRWTASSPCPNGTLRPYLSSSMPSLLLKISALLSPAGTTLRVKTATISERLDPHNQSRAAPSTRGRRARVSRGE
jgi:hypothetical protein